MADPTSPSTPATSTSSSTIPPNLPIGTLIYWQGSPCEFHGIMAGTDAVAVRVFEEKVLTVLALSDVSLTQS